MNAHDRAFQNLCLVTALRDADGELLAKAEQNWPALKRRFGAIAVHLTNDTHLDWSNFLSDQDIPTGFAEPGWDFIGLHRRRCLELGLTHTRCERFLYADPDHILRWVERRPEELDRVLEQVGRNDCLVIGRSGASFSAAPERLQATETIINQIFKLTTGHAWDVMMAARGLTRRAAELIVAESTEDTLGNDVAWPLLVRQHGLTLGFMEATGLTYETNTVYARNILDNLDTDPAAWMLRVYTANQHVDAMRPFLEQPEP